VEIGMGQVVEDEGKYHEEKQKPKDISLTPSM
jgi:hypothetical protein